MDVLYLFAFITILRPAIFFINSLGDCLLLSANIRSASKVVFFHFLNLVLLFASTRYIMTRTYGARHWNCVPCPRPCSIANLFCCRYVVTGHTNNINSCVFLIRDVTFLFKINFSLGNGIVGIGLSFAAKLTLLVETALINVTQRSILDKVGVGSVVLPKV